MTLLERLKELESYLGNIVVLGEKEIKEGDLITCHDQLKAYKDIESKLPEIIQTLEQSERVIEKAVELDKRVTKLESKFARQQKLLYEAKFVIQNTLRVKGNETITTPESLKQITFMMDWLAELERMNDEKL